MTDHPTPITAGLSAGGSIPSTADVYDEVGATWESLPLQLRSFGRRTRFAGAVRTVRCHEDNALLKSVLQTPGEGAVLVIDGGGSLRTALVGDVIAAIAVENGWSGLVVHGAIRDSALIDALDIGVKALGTNPRKGGKAGTGTTDEVVEFGGVRFRPGALLVSDEDGILVAR